VNAAPPPPRPNWPGDEIVPTTCIAAVRAPPVGACTVTRTTDPTCACTWCSVVDPRAISSSPAGRRPDTFDRSRGPRTASPATAKTLVPLMETSFLVPSMMPVTAGSCCRLATSAVMLPGPSSFEINSW